MRIAICVSVLTWITGAVAAGPATEDYAGDLRSSVAAVREHAVVSLGRAGDRSATPLVIAALKDPDDSVRREAAKALGFLKDARAALPLVASLHDRNPNVRLYAAYALGEIKDPQTAGPLVAALGDAEWCVRDQAAWALREVGDAKIAGPLVAALQDPKADVDHIVWVLRYLGSPAVLDQLLPLLQGADPAARARAAGALGELRLAGAVGPLVGALGDADPAVRRAAVEALRTIGDDRAEKPIEELAAREQDASVREAAREALFQLSRRKDLAAHWSFDDRSTSVAKDVTGCGTDGQVRGCTPVEGKVGYALQFSEGRYVELGKPAALPIGGVPFTVMAWAKSDAPNGVVVARGGAFCGFSLYLKDGVARFGIHRDQQGPAYIAAGRESVVGRWVHLAGVVKDDRIELYVDGKLAAAEKTPGYIPGNCGQGMEIGYDQATSPAEITDSFEGIIDEVKVYQAALNGDDIAKQCGSETSK